MIGGMRRFIFILMIAVLLAGCTTRKIVISECADTDKQIVAQKTGEISE
ncbi:MAG: lipoprotein [Nitrospirota bacterium]